MKADWDDTPRHVRRNGKNAWVRWLVPGLAGCALVFGLLNLAGTHFAFPRFNDQPAEPPAEYAHTDPYGNEAERQPQTATAEEQFWADQRRKEEQRRAQAQAQQRQTDFNDHNYTPRQPDNVVSMEGVRQSLAYQQPNQQATTRRRSIEKDARWIEKWSGGGSYYATWTIVNNYIDNGSVCDNHKRGSIDYRECRKGAKQFFKAECRGWGERLQQDREPSSELMKQRYCSAASSFSPMM